MHSFHLHHPEVSHKCTAKSVSLKFSVSARPEIGRGPRGIEKKNMAINLCLKMAQLIPLMRGGWGMAGQPPPHTRLPLYKISEQAIHSQILKVWRQVLRASSIGNRPRFSKLHSRHYELTVNVKKRGNITVTNIIKTCFCHPQSHLQGLERSVENLRLRPQLSTLGLPYKPCDCKHGECEGSSMIYRQASWYQIYPGGGGGACWSTVYRCVNKGPQNLP